MQKSIKMLWITMLLGITGSAWAGPNADIGTVVGGIAGGILGNSIVHGSGRAAATIGGAVVGGLVGNQMGSSSDRAYYGPHYRYTHWETAPYPARYYRPIQTNTYIGRNGRLCRKRIILNRYGEKIVATYCCYNMSPHQYCTRWVRVG